MDQEMCLEITYSAIAKYPEIFFDALKTGQMKNPIFFKKLTSEKSMCNYLKIFKIYSTSSLIPCLHKKTLSGWEMELSLVKIA